MSESQIKANPTKSTLDSIEHEADLEDQRKKRAESAVDVPNPANEARKAGTDDGDKQPDDYSDEYPMKEGKARTPRADKSESNPNPSALNQ